MPGDSLAGRGPPPDACPENLGLYLEPETHDEPDTGPGSPFDDVLDVGSLPLRWLPRDEAGATALAYRHYLPPAAAATAASPAPSPGAQLDASTRPPPAPGSPPAQPSPPRSAAATAAASPGTSGPPPLSYPPPLPTPPDVCVFFCNGLKSHMTGAKVRRALNVAAACGAEFLCFDYSGFGDSSGGRRFEACGLQDWLDDAAALLARVVRAKRVVILGSSIGGWVALRLAQLAARGQAVPTSPASSAADSSFPAATAAAMERPATASTAASATPGPTIAGLLLIAPAVDLSEVRWAALSEAQQRAVLYDSALVSMGSPYQMDGGDAVGLPYFEQGRRNLLHCPWARAEPLRPGVSYPGPLRVVPQSLLQPESGQQPSPASTRPQTERTTLAAAAAQAAAATCAPDQQAAATTAVAAAAAAGASGQSVGTETVASPAAVPPATCQGGRAGAGAAASSAVGSGSDSVGISVGLPVVILHGSEDEVVPLQHSEALLGAINAATTTAAGAAPTADAAASAAAALVTLAGGCHRLSSPEGLRALHRVLRALLVRGGSGGPGGLGRGAFVGACAEAVK